MPRKRRPTPTPVPVPEPTPTPTPTPVPPPPTPTGDLPGWKQIFTEDFATPCTEGQFLTAYAGKWSAYPKGWQDTSKHGTYDPAIISVADGVMSMRIHTTPDGVHHVAAPYPLLPVPVITQYNTPNTPQLYGRYSVRFRSDSMHGYKVAWLLWPMSGVWPRDGEIDFPEGDLDSTFAAFMHRQEGSSGSDQDYVGTGKTMSDWHVAVIEWGPTQCRFLVDDVVMGTVAQRSDVAHPNGIIPNTPMRWVLQTETALLPAPPPDAAVTGRVQVDRVVVWAKA